MSEHASSSPNGEQLWQQFAGARPGSSENCPSAADMAAYLDARLADHERDAIESHLSTCPACLESVQEIRAMLAHSEEALPLVPASVIDSAKDLVKSRHASTSSDVSAPLRFADFQRRAARWGLVAAASLAVCIVGFQAGSSSYRPQATEGDRLLSEISFGLYDTDDSAIEIVSLYDSGFEEVMP